MNFRDYILSQINEATKFSVDQKNELNHFILNILMNKELAGLLKKTKTDDSENITISKKDAKSILKNINSIRTFILSLPRED